MRLLMASMGCKTQAVWSGRRRLTQRRWHAGQATVEFALVLFAFLALLAGLGALSNFMQSGKLVEHANASASHAVGSGDTWAWVDVLAY